MLYLSFSCLTVLGWASRTMLDKILKVGTLVLFLILEILQLFTTEYDDSCGPVRFGLYYVEVYSFYAQFVWEFLPWNHVEFCQILFLHLLRYRPKVLTHIILFSKEVKYFKISCKAGLLVTNFLHFCLSEKVFLLHFWRIISRGTEF